MLPTICHLLAHTAGQSSEQSTKQPAEQFCTLLQTAQLRLERIDSHGQASPAGFWYDQPEAEWVMLLQGAACLEFASGSLMLGAGDALLIPAHCRHRVAACSNDARWLALHLSGTPTE